MKSYEGTMRQKNLHSPKINVVMADTSDRMAIDPKFFRLKFSFPCEAPDPRAFFHQDGKFYIVEGSGKVRILENHNNKFIQTGV